MSLPNRGNQPMGLLGFFGVIEEVAGDPLQLGRVKVRIFNHTDNGNPPSTEELQWTTIMGSINSPSNGTGISPTWLQIGTKVVGVYLDGSTKNIPILMGTLYTIPEMDMEQHGVAALARGENTIEKEPLGPEPASAYAAEYPFNKVIDTPGGHVIELDDTPDNERIHIYHKSGSYIEINKDGRMVRKVKDSDFEIIATDQEVYIGGKSNVHILGDATVKVDGKYSVESGGDMDFKAGGNINMNGSRINLN